MDVPHSRREMILVCYKARVPVVKILFKSLKSAAIQSKQGEGWGRDENKTMFNYTPRLNWDNFREWC